MDKIRLTRARQIGFLSQAYQPRSSGTLGYLERHQDDHNGNLDEN